jgi:hypothetical protein
MPAWAAGDPTRAILRHFLLVCCAFSFCWHATHGVADPQPPAPEPEPPPARQALALSQQAARTAALGAHRSSPSAVDPAAAWPIALRRVRGWLNPWRELQRLWRAWSTSPPPPPLQAMLEWGHCG